jgi:sugar O-acyltransferase (sialic acid O-acetyltransferase NeuD family)
MRILKSPVILVGGGRLAGLLVETFHKQVKFAGYIDDIHEQAYVEEAYRLPKLGTSSQLPSLRKKYALAVVAITDVQARRKYAELLTAAGYTLQTLVAPSAEVADNATVGAGCIIRQQAVIGPRAVIGDNTVVSDLAYVGHDCRIGRNVYVAPGANLNGSVTIGDNTFIGTGAVVLPERTVGSGSVVAAAACVIRDLEDGGRVAGIPAVAIHKQRPAVSVVMSAYNHERYTAESIASVLEQTHGDFEFIIIDDGSTDGTADVIRQFSDPRIRTRFLETNQGLISAKNLGYRMAEGKYIAILNSDDAFLPDKLERQAAFLDTHPDAGAVLTQVQVVDEQGRPFTDENHFYYKIFDQPNRTRFEWLRRFFFEGNCLCAPSAMVRREAFETIGWPDSRLHQLPDFDLWVRICLRYELHILPEKLTRFRIRDGSENASNSGAAGITRNLFEFPKVLRHYLRIPDEKTLLRIFPEAEKYAGPLFPLDEDLIPFIVARLSLDLPHNRWRIFGAETLFELLGDPRRARKIHDAFGYTYRDLIRTTGAFALYQNI